jgi:hypothetical protein
MTRQKIEDLAIQAGIKSYALEMATEEAWQQTGRFVELIIQECIDNLFFHGHDEAANQLEWLRVNRFGIKK